jgi:hypothetical protein
MALPALPSHWRTFVTTLVIHTGSITLPLPVASPAVASPAVPVEPMLLSLVVWPYFDLYTPVVPSYWRPFPTNIVLYVAPLVLPAAPPAATTRTARRFCPARRAQVDAFIRDQALVTRGTFQTHAAERALEWMASEQWPRFSRPVIHEGVGTSVAVKFAPVLAQLRAIVSSRAAPAEAAPQPPAPATIAPHPLNGVPAYTTTFSDLTEEFQVRCTRPPHHT